MERLEAVESSGDELGDDVCTNSYRNPDGPAAAAMLREDDALIRELVEALRSIGSQACCFGMRADENELRDWLKFISETAEEVLAKAQPGGSNAHSE